MALSLSVSDFSIEKGRKDFLVGEGEGGASSSGNKSFALDLCPTLFVTGEGVKSDVNLAELGGEVAEVLRGVSGTSFCIEAERMGEV